MFYIVGTAIGNIEDTTMRAVNTLALVDAILAEDTRNFSRYYKRVQKLFNIFPKKQQKLISFHDQNEYARIPQVLDYLKKEKDVALVSESGMPLISDPGSSLVKYLINNNFAFMLIPGPTAFVSAAVRAGFKSNRIHFLGFFPKNKQAKIRLINQLNESASKDIKPTIVFYESPHRINMTLEIIAELLPDAQIVICREMTKRYEETLRGNVKELVKNKFKGELTVALNLSS